MAVAGSLTYDTKIDKKGFEKGLNSLKTTTNTVGGQIKSIVTALGIDKLISTTFSLLNNSIDGAISRLDTLNNYPKVMSNLGIASEDAQKSINKMSDKLSGLPTTLDEGALAVQRFTSANGNIQKSTDYFLALNNAILAGGASTDIQSSALEQLSQAYAKGKPDMMEWRSLMTAMPAQLKQVATAMGYISTDALGEDLRNGKVSMDDFMDTIVKLNAQGTGEFQSFEEQARNSTGGIATSITVAKTQITKGVADIINKIDELLKNNGLGGIGEIISNIGNKVKETLSGISERLPDIISFLERISPLIIGIVSGLIAYKMALLAIQAIQFIQGIIGMISAFISLIPAIKSVNDAMLLLNMTFAVNPVVLIIAAIVALIAIFVVLWNKCEWFRDFWIDLWKKIQSVFEPVINSLVNMFQQAWELIKVVWDYVSPYFEYIFNNIMIYVNFLKDVIVNSFSLAWKIIQQVWNVATAYFKGIFDTIAGIFEVVKDVLSGDFRGAWEAIKRVFASWRQYFNTLWEAVKSVFSGVASFFGNIFSSAWNAVKSAFSNFGNFFNNLFNETANIGRNIVEGIWNGIKNAGNWIKQKVGEFAKGILDGMKEALGIHSPSKLFRDEIGKFIPQGVAVGIETDTDSAIKAIDKMNGEIMSEMNKAIVTEKDSINANAKIKSNNNIMNIINANLKTGIQSIENNKEIVVNAVTNLDGKVLTNTVNRVNAKQKLQYGTV